MKPDSQAIEFFNRNGFVKIENVFSPDEVANFLREYEYFLENDAPLLKGRDINYADQDKKVVNSIHKLHVREGNFFDKLLKSDRMRALASNFLTSPAVGRAAEMFAKPAGKGLKSPAHQDNFYWCLQPCRPNIALTIWIALDTCSIENGGVSYLVGSHTKGILDHVDSYAPGSSQTVADKDRMSSMSSVTPTLNPGDVIIHDSLTIHYSADNTSGKSRRGMTLQYQAQEASIDPNMLNHYESQLKKQVEAREQQY